MTGTTMEITGTTQVDIEAGVKPERNRKRVQVLKIETAP